MLCGNSRNNNKDMDSSARIIAAILSGFAVRGHIHSAAILINDTSVLNINRAVCVYGMDHTVHAHVANRSRACRMPPCVVSSARFAHLNESMRPIDDTSRRYIEPTACHATTTL